MTIFLRKLMACLCVFFLLQSSVSAQVLKQEQFNPNNTPADDTAYQNYLLKNDGTHIAGKTVSWNRKNEATADDVAYPLSDLRGIHIRNAYYGKVAPKQLTFKNQLVKRIIHGKINIYTFKGDAQSGNQKFDWYMYFSQVGEDGDIVLLSNLDELQELVKDCDVAVSMLDKSNEEAKKALRKEHGYLNRVIETYNNDCKAVSE